MRTRSASVSQFWVRWSTSVSTAEVSNTSSTCCKEKVQVELEVQMGWCRKSNRYGFRHSKLAFDLILILSTYIIFQWFLTIFRRGEGNITNQSFEQLIKDWRKYNYWNQKPSISIPYDSVLMKCSLIDRNTMADLSDKWMNMKLHVNDTGIKSVLSWMPGGWWYETILRGWHYYRVCDGYNAPLWSLWYQRFLGWYTVSCMCIFDIQRLVCRGALIMVVSWLRRFIELE